MPFCEACDRHWTPTSMRPDGTCPDCGLVLPLVEARSRGGGEAPQGGDEVDEATDQVEADEAADQVEADEAADDEVPSAPWHFKVMLVALAVYLAWRGVQGVEWLMDRL